MLDSDVIRSHLKELNSYYSDSTSSPALVLMVAKLAVLELSGWTEECLHNIARTTVSTNGSNARALELVEATIQRIHGVNYRQHVQRLFSVAFGANRLAAIESKLKKVA